MEELPGTITYYRGRFRARVSYGGKRLSVGTFDARADAKGAIAEFWRLHAVTASKVPGLLTVKEWGETYLNARETDGVHRAVKRDRSVWKSRVDGFDIGAMHVDTLTPRDVRAWIATQIKTPSKRTGERPEKQTVANALNLLRVALEAAVEAGHCETNAARDVRVPKMATDKESWTWLREDEIDRLLSSPNVDAESRRLFTVAIFTGLRQGELIGLRWQDVDLKRGELTVCKSFEVATKGGRIRRVPLLGPALAAIKVQPRRCNLVFPQADSQMRHHGDDAGIHAALEAAGVRRVRFHDLRHTCASHLVQGTWAPELVDGPLRLVEVQHWLGHKSIVTTERYAHLAPDAVHSRVKRAGEKAAAPRGLKWTHLDSAVPDDVAQLAGIVTTLEPPIRIERTAYGLRKGGLTPVVSNSSPVVSPVADQIVELLQVYARKERPSDAAVVRALGAAMDAIRSEHVKPQRKAT